MRLTGPHIGDICVAVKALTDYLGIDFVALPPTSPRTLSLGTRHSPEAVCLPFKLTLGNMIEALELGTDTILMTGGDYGCRFGYYHKVQQAILQGLGYDFVMLTQELGIVNMLKYATGGAPIRKVLTGFRFGLAKLKALEDLEQAAHKIRPVERDKGRASQICRDALESIGDAGDNQSVMRIRQQSLQDLTSLPTVPSPDPLKIGITGEFYVVIDSFANMDIKAELGRLGAEVYCPTSLGKWVTFNPFAVLLALREKGSAHKAAKPYLSGTVFGDGWQSVGEKLIHAADWDGMVHLEPFGCMPEVIARNIMPSTQEELPVLNIIFDENTAKAGLIIRLEAFVDMLRRKKRQPAKA